MPDYKIQFFDSLDELIKTSYLHVKNTGKKLYWTSDPERGLTDGDYYFLTLKYRYQWESFLYREIFKRGLSITNFVNQQDDELMKELEMLVFYS